MRAVYHRGLAMGVIPTVILNPFFPTLATKPNTLPYFHTDTPILCWLTSLLTKRNQPKKTYSLPIFGLIKRTFHLVNHMKKLRNMLKNWHMNLRAYISFWHGESVEYMDKQKGLIGVS